MTLIAIGGHAAIRFALLMRQNRRSDRRAAGPQAKFDTRLPNHQGELPSPRDKRMCDRRQAACFTRLAILEIVARLHPVAAWMLLQDWPELRH
jgi:hypothetical protein